MRVTRCGAHREVFMNTIFSPGRWLAIVTGALLLASVPHGVAIASPDAIQAAEHLLAVTQLRATTTAADQVKADAKSQSAGLESATAADRKEIAALQEQLLVVLAKDDTAALQVIRARLSARQAALDADEGALSLLQHQVEESDRERDLWQKRVATLELVQRMDLKVMLAGAAEIADRVKRVEAAEKEMETQLTQIRKFAARREAALARRDMLRRRLAALEPCDVAELQTARTNECAQLRRLISQQEEIFRQNRVLDLRARRNLAFARSDYLISCRFAEALERKADVQRAAELQATAEHCDGQLMQLRTALTRTQQRAAANLAAAVTETDEAQHAIGEARAAAEEEKARAVYAQAQARKNRWEAETDCWKELVALQRAGVAFAHELGDRARGLAEDRSLTDLTQEEEQLRATLVTSEQYANTLELQLQKLDAQIEAARHELGLDPARVPEFAATWTALLASYDPSHPPAIALVADLLSDLADHRIPDDSSLPRAWREQRREVGGELVARIAQRELLRTRKAISARWLANTHAAIETLEQLAGRQLWLQHDPRLNAVTFRETLAMVWSVAENASFTWVCWRRGVPGVPGVPGAHRILLGAVLILAIGVAGWLASRAIKGNDRLRRLARELTAYLPPLVVAAMLAGRAGQNGGLPLTWLGWFLPAITIWVLVRNLLLVCTPKHEMPSFATMGGALLRAADAILLWTALLWPFDQVAVGMANSGDIRAVLERGWLFGVCLAVFCLAMHPALMGRFLNGHSKNAVLRVSGNVTTLVCVVVAALVVLTYLARLDSLGRSVLHTAEGTVVSLVVPMALAALLGRTMRHAVATSNVVWALVRIAQVLVLLVSAIGVVCIWWLLLNRAVLASNAPPPLPEMVQATGRALHTVAGVWHAHLGASMTVGSLVRGLLIFVVSFWVARHAKGVMHQRVLSRTPMDEATRHTFANVFGHLVIALGFLVALNVAGSSLQNLALLAGAITIGIGFGLQNVINNLVSSLLIHFSRSIRVGDYIEVGSPPIRGTVREIGMRNTTLQTDDEISVLVPNGSFITSNIVNWTIPTRRIRLHVPLIVVRKADLTAVSEMAKAEAGRHPLVLKVPAPTLEVRGATATQVTLDLQIWIEHPEKGTSIIGELTLALDHTLREKGFVV